MSHLQISLLLFFVFIVVNIHCSIVTVTSNSTELHLQAPLVGDKIHSNRPSLRLRINGTRRRFKPKKIPNKDLLNPCNGAYVKTNGTTCGLKEMMIGRCYEFEYVKPGFSVSNRTSVKNCTALYKAFELAVRYKPYCNMNMSTYKDYFDIALAGVRVIDRAMFWSGTYAIAHAYSANGLNYITLEDTLAAAMVNGLVWCGKENDTEGYDFVSCPNNCKDNIWADVSFWGLASKTFAQLAAGEIYVVLNGSQSSGRSAFRNNSYFSEFELPNFRRNGTYPVTKVNTLLLHSPDRAVTERCGEKSLLLLEESVRRQGFDYVCKDDPDELILIMCGNQWNARECQIARQVLRYAWDRKLSGKSNYTQVSLVLLLIYLMFLFVIIV